MSSTDFLAFILWYFVGSLAGLAVFPLAFRLLPALPDRGYTLSRALGLLLWGYLFWLLASLGLIRNELGGLILTLGAIIGLGVYTYVKLPAQALSDWFRQNKALIWAGEILFLLAFAGWTFVRAANPEILGTEKPMELAFINAILRSPDFPPHDPWLSGYAISYYYFGYVLVAMLAQLTLTPGSVAFNLGIALIFALSAMGAFGLVYNLAAATEARGSVNRLARRTISNVGYGLLGPLFVLIVSNLEGALEMLHARGLFWHAGSDGQLTSRFWQWLDMMELSQPPAQPLSWLPTRFYWWWRASRVVQDYNLDGAWKEIIDEFPFFSYLLADLHPHVLAMPFAFVAMAIALNIYLGGAAGTFRWFGLSLHLSLPAFVLAAIVVGGLAFLNTWDFPIYAALLCAAYALSRFLQGNEPGLVRPPGPDEDPALLNEAASQVVRRRRSSWPGLAKDFFLLGLALIITGIVLYLPFYFGFSSQAGGILPHLTSPTRGAHLWVMFGPLLIPAFAYLLFLWGGFKDWKALGRGLLWATGLVLALWALSLALGFFIALLPGLGNLSLGSIGANGSLGSVFSEIMTRRFTSLGWVTLLILLAFVLALLLPEWRARGERSEMSLAPGEPGGGRTLSRLELPHGFTLLLILFGVLLVLFTDFFFLRDQFGWRMNTVFKFYFQAWLLWGIAAAFGTGVLLRELRGIGSLVFRIGLVLLLTAALIYPVLGLLTKTNGFRPPAGFTLDGAAYLERSSPDDMAAIAWLRQAPPGVVLEAVGGSYSDYARVATLSGQPDVLGWPGHESQWRGGSQEMGSRQADIERIYRSSRWEEIKPLLDKYQVRYIFIGALERSAYRVIEEKFKEFLEPVFNQGQVTIYQVPLS